MGERAPPPPPLPPSCSGGPCCPFHVRVVQKQSPRTRVFLCAGVCCSVTVLTGWVAPPKMVYNWCRVWWSRNQLWNCTHFGYPTDDQLLFHFYFGDIIVKIGHTRTHYSFLIQRTKSYPPVLAADRLELKCHRRTDCLLSRRHTWRKTSGDFGSLKTSYFLKIITCNCTKGFLPCQDEIQLQPCAIRTKIQHKPDRNKEFWQVYVMVGR